MNDELGDDEGRQRHKKAHLRLDVAEERDLSAAPGAARAASNIGTQTIAVITGTRRCRRPNLSPGKTGFAEELEYRAAENEREVVQPLAGDGFRGRHVLFRALFCPRHVRRLGIQAAVGPLPPQLKGLFVSGTNDVVVSRLEPLIAHNSVDSKQ
jgi:hypothetical protein